MFGDAFRDEMAGQGMEGRCFYPDRDLRASKREQQRDRKQKEKYYRYRASNPGMVGQKYYTLTFTRPAKGGEASRSWKRQRRTRQNENVEEVEDSLAFKNSAKQSWGCHRLDTNELAVAAAASANRHCRSPASAMEDGTTVSCEILDQALEEYHQFSSKYREWSMEHYLTSRKYIDAHLRLKVQTWTKRDNYANRVTFNDYYTIGKWHHSRKLCSDEKRYQKMTLRKLGRDMKSRSAIVLPYKSSANRWESIVEEGCYCSCSLCNPTWYADLNTSLNARGVEEYLWKWDEECFCGWDDECTCEWADFNVGEGCISYNDVSWPACLSYAYETFDVDDNPPEDFVDDTDQIDAASPGALSASWIFHMTSDTESDFDLLSDCGKSGAEWEEVLPVP